MPEVRFFISTEKADWYRGFGPNRVQPSSLEKPKAEGERTYFAINLDPSDPYSCFNGNVMIAPEDVVSVDWKQTIHAGFRPDGHYEMNDARLSVRTMQGGESQMLVAVADYYESLRDIVVAARTGRLQPKYDFTAKPTPEMKPLILERSTSKLPDPESIEHVGSMLHELLVIARRCRAQDVSHSITWVANHWYVVVSGFYTEVADS